MIKLVILFGYGQKKINEHAIKHSTMKRILLCIVFSCLLAGAASAQFGAKPTSKEDIALMMLSSTLEKIDSVSDKQLQKLVELEIKIDEEFHHFNSYPPPQKK